MAAIFLYGIPTYLGVGLLVAAAFLIFGVGRTLPEARGTSPLFRLLVLPGCAALWPLVIARSSSARRSDA